MILNMMGGGGSGGVELNFEVVGGTSQPTNPKENTIWVNTDTEVTGYCFMSTKPTVSVVDNGYVYILVGTDSPVEFSATVNNPIVLYPVSALQCVNGNLVSVTATSYINGEWVSWITYLFKTNEGYGNEFTARIYATSYGSSNVTDERICLRGILTGFKKNNVVDLTPVTTLCFNVYCVSNSGYKLGVSSVDPVNNFLIALTFEASCIPATGTNVYRVDVSSLSGEYYIGGRINNQVGDGEMYIYDIWLE